MDESKEILVELAGFLNTEYRAYLDQHLGPLSKSLIRHRIDYRYRRPI